MSAAKKIGPVFDDQINAKIQRQFDLIFTAKNSENAVFSNEDKSKTFNESINFDIKEMVMENDGKNKSSPTIGLDLSSDDEAPVIPERGTGLDLSKKDDDGLGFSLDFDLEIPDDSKTLKTAVTQSSSVHEIEESGGFTLDDSDIAANLDFNADATQKTIMMKPDQMQKSNLNEFKLEQTGSLNISVDMMSSEEAKANIETTIKDIVRPLPEGTSQLEVSMTHTGLTDVEDSDLEFSNTPSKGFALADIGDDAFAIDTGPRAPLPEIEDDGELFDLDGPTVTTSKKAPAPIESTNEFDINALTEEEVDEATRIAMPMPNPAPKREAPAAPPVHVHERAHAEPVHSPNTHTSSMGMGGSSLNSEDSVRFQATIRALREEREEMLLQIKNLKSDSKELEQDNLTLKANLDEAKIEITILRKRHMVEIEDLKYRLTMSEEKKAMAQEMARQADLRREKLEQKVRIDFNQVKQREKELESKLELLSMDVDSQVQSREQKILELRRKIDALEFNMENASIKEQKSLDDKRKLEDRLNKIMKTLRHSIKNLEDDIDQVEEDSDHQKDKN